MADEVKQILSELQHIKDYLTKLGPGRRTSAIKEGKGAEALYLYNKSCSLNNLISIQIANKEIKYSDTQYIHKLFDKINSLYSRIVQLCSESTDSDPSTASTMEKFELKTAASLLPVMTGDETVTKQLISNIEMYETMIDDSSKKLLILFVLKSRLSESAKLRMCSNYLTVTDLLRDMRSILLTKKSDTAIQSQLQSIRQDNKTIQEFGKQVEKLFVDLTVSQANGDSSAYELLKPLNERNAIKRFSDGLRNSRLSTIIAARNYSTLKDAIQGALDETLCSGGNDQRVMSFHHNRGRSNNSNYFSNRYSRPGFSRNFSKGSNRGGPVSQSSNHYGRGYNRGYRGNMRNFSARGYNNHHGPSSFRGHTWVRSQARQNQINLAEMNISDSNQKPEIQENNDKDNNWFFRA